MRNGFRLFLMGALGLSLCATAARADDPKKDDSAKRVQFDTLDGVTLEGTFWAADPAAKEKQATVLLLHNIDAAKGGSSHEDGWDDLAKTLSAQGYAVMSFDFRGFGNSHAISKDFWDSAKGKENRAAMPSLANRNPPPDRIDHKDFDARAGTYYPYLVNDIVAAKSYLDRHSGEGGNNPSNLIVIGAGQGATIGAEWMTTQWHLKRFTGYDKFGKQMMDEPEGRDLAGAVWLDLSPTLGGRTITAYEKSWLIDMAAENKVPMVFFTGKDSESAKALADEALTLIEARVHRDNPKFTADQIKDKLQLTNVKAIDAAKLTDSKLLGAPETAAFIKKYVDKVVDERGPREARKHDTKDEAYFWTFPGRNPVPAKTKTDEVIQPVPMDSILRSYNP